MRLTWTADADAWLADVSHAGPAGTADIAVGSVWVEFDRVDSGRIVSIRITPDEDAAKFFEDAWPALGRPAQDGEIADVDLSDTPLWLMSRELARAAELVVDAARLAREGDRNAAAIAYAELAEVLYQLDDFAPMQPTVALRRLIELMSGDRPLIYDDGGERYERVLSRILQLAPTELHAQLTELREPVTVSRAIRVAALEPVFAVNRDANADTQRPDGELLGLMQRANDLGREALCIERSEPANAAQAWRRCARAWLDLDETGRAAIALDRAADIELRQGEKEAAAEDRRNARKLAPPWVLPVLGGHTGSPQQPLWTLAPTVPTGTTDSGWSRELAPQLGGQRPSVHGGTAHWSSAAEPTGNGVGVPGRSIARLHRPGAGRSYVFLSYPRDASDAEYVYQLADELVANGIPVWYDRLQATGDRWQRELEARIDACAALVVVMSPAAESSPWVQAEVSRAQARGLPVYPILRSGPVLSRLANIRFESLMPGQVLPSGQFIDRLRGELAAAERSRLSPGARLLGRGFPPHNPYFLGRDKPLRTIEGLLSAGRPVVVQAVNGNAGVGKTALAAEFAYAHRAQYRFIAWIDAQHPELIADQIAAIAPEFGMNPGRMPAETAHAVIAAMADIDDPWLMVFDNAQRLADLTPWLGHGATAGNTIITSLRDEWYPPISPVKIDVISTDDAVELLQKRFSTVDDKTAADIVRLVGHLPLALEQAAGHLARTGVPASEYLDDLGSRYVAALRAGSDTAREMGYAPGSPQHAVAAVWDVSRPVLQRDDPAAAQLLQLCSFLGPAPIPLELYTQHADLLPKPLGNTTRDDLQFSRAVDELVARSLVHHGADGLSVHPLLAQAVGRRMSIQQRQEAVQTVWQILAEHLRGDDDEATRAPRNVSVWRALMPHVLSVTNDIDRTSGARDRASFLLAGAGNYLRVQNQPAGQPLLERALRIDEETRPEDRVVARRLNSLAMLLKDVVKRPDEAVPLLRRALDIDERLGGDSVTVANDLGDLAAVLHDLGKSTEADQLRARARRILENERDERSADREAYHYLHKYFVDDPNTSRSAEPPSGDEWNPS